nr:flavin reductase family protein [Psychromicrobium silvestre]
MRTVLGHFATGLTVVTAHDSTGPVGFTCQSFTSLSLEPPLISINPTKGSSTWPKIRQLGSFAVNILPAGSEQLALDFSRKGIDRFDRVDWEISAAGHPHLGGALAWVDCELEAEHEAGDHSIAIARVHRLEAAEAGGHPLLFFKGGFLPLAAELAAEAASSVHQLPRRIGRDEPGRNEQRASAGQDVLSA